MTAEANGQEIVAIKTTLAKVSQIKEMKLVTLKKGREPVADVGDGSEEDTVNSDDRMDLFVVECVCLCAN